MTIQIPVRFLLFVLYTAAILGGAFGISYAVFEWRDEGEGSDGGITLQSLDSRIDSLSSSVGGPTGISSFEARTIAQEEANMAFARAVKAIICIESFRGSGLSTSQGEAAIRGCLEE